MRLLIGGVAVALATACSPGPGVTRPMPRGVVIQGSTQKYRVVGSTEAEIGASLRAAGVRENGFVGHYQARWRYAYRLSSGGGGALHPTAGCRISDVRVDLQSVVREPDWQRTADAPAELAAEWESFAAALDDHERAHEKLAVDLAGDLVRTLEQLRALSCQELSVEANREGERMSARLDEQQARLDQETRHGMLTGARWPPPRHATGDSTM